jgi:hypothetical protein
MDVKGSLARPATYSDTSRYFVISEFGISKFYCTSNASYVVLVVKLVLQYLLCKSPEWMISWLYDEIVINEEGSGIQWIPNVLLLTELDDQVTSGIKAGDNLQLILIAAVWQILFLNHSFASRTILTLTRILCHSC